jgi:hypothetical protein
LAELGLTSPGPSTRGAIRRAFGPPLPQVFAGGRKLSGGSGRPSTRKSTYLDRSLKNAFSHVRTAPCALRFTQSLALEVRFSPVPRGLSPPPPLASDPRQYLLLRAQHHTQQRRLLLFHRQRQPPLRRLPSRHLLPVPLRRLPSRHQPRVLLCPVSPSLKPVPTRPNFLRAPSAFRRAALGLCVIAGNVSPAATRRARRAPIAPRISCVNQEPTIAHGPVSRTSIRRSSTKNRSGNVRAAGALPNPKSRCNTRMHPALIGRLRLTCDASAF